MGLNDMHPVKVDGYHPSQHIDQQSRPPIRTEESAQWFALSGLESVGGSSPTDSATDDI